MNKLSYLKLMIFAFVPLFIGCNSDDTIPEYIHDHEGIHEFIIQQTNLDGSHPVQYEFVEGNSVGETIRMTSGETYNFEIIALNAHEDDGHEHNILPEVLEAVEEHFFVYAKSQALNLSLVRTDEAISTQNDGTKIGVKTQITANAISSGNLEITLKHQATEVDDLAHQQFGTAIGGATDVLVNFPVEIN